MRKSFIWGVLVLALFSFTCESFALGGYQSLSGDNKKIAELLKENLKLSEEDAYGVFIEHFESQLNTENWHLGIYHNESLDLSSVKESDNRFLTVNFVTDNRFVNIAIVKFSKEKELLIQVMETLPRSSSIGIDKYNELKKDQTYSLDAENAKFALFNKKGYTKGISILVSDPVSGIQFRNFYRYELKH